MQELNQYLVTLSVIVMSESPEEAHEIVTEAVDASEIFFQDGVVSVGIDDVDSIELVEVDDEIDIDGD